MLQKRQGESLAFFYQRPLQAGGSSVKSIVSWINDGLMRVEEDAEE